MRFFALPDSNTSQRVAISVLGHVVVSQMDIVQVPYATVTGKYVRALSYALPSYGLCSYGLYSYGLCSYGLCSYGLCSYGIRHYDLCTYGLYSYGLYSYGPCIWLWPAVIVGPHISKK